jgi:small-conductance mechanosensitive channel
MHLTLILTALTLAEMDAAAHLRLRHQWFVAVFLVSSAIVLSNVVHFIVFRIVRRKEVQASMPGWGMQSYLGRPARVIFILTCVLAVLPSVPDLPYHFEGILRQGIIMAIIVAIGWFAVGLIYVFQAFTMRRYDLTAEDNIQARRVHTQLQLVRRLLMGFVVIVDAGALLWSFDDPRIWHYGSGLLASAGVASLILATAAKSTAANILAGLQIAFSEPIRIDDVVVVQGEQGNVEEINSAYVVIKLWDLRRLVVPLSFFIENSFQNWSREANDIMGAAFLYVDYSVPVDALRSYLQEIVSDSPLWDGKLCALQVTKLTEKTMELRCAVSSRNAAQNFDLRCEVREKMTAYIRENYPDAFPTMRFATRHESKDEGTPQLQ